MTHTSNRDTSTGEVTNASVFEFLSMQMLEASESLENLQGNLGRIINRSEGLQEDENIALQNIDHVTQILNQSAVLLNFISIQETNKDVFNLNIDESPIALHSFKIRLVNFCHTGIYEGEFGKIRNSNFYLF